MMRDPQLAAAVREWAPSVPAAVREGALWPVGAHRLGPYVCDEVRDGATAPSQDTRTRSVAGPLHRVLGSVGANAAEGHPRGGGRGRNVKGRRVLGEDQAGARVQTLTSVVRLLLMATRGRRGVHLRERAVPYESDTGGLGAGGAGAD